MRISNFTPLTLLLALVAMGCGACDDAAQTSFFEPESFGTYELVIEPDIDAPRVLDFGAVPPGAAPEQELLVRNLGRDTLVVGGAEVTLNDFRIVGEPSDRIPPLDGDWFNLEFRPTTSAPVTARLDIYSNDPDEPVFPVTLLANRREPCVGSFNPGSPVWEVHDGEGPLCFANYSPAHGHVEEYENATIPSSDDAGWRPEPDDRISFERRSTLCGFECSCRDGGDFTYFQTFLVLPDDAELRRYVVEIRDVDDGARVTVFNEEHPDGVTAPDSYARLPGGSTSDLAQYLRTGSNRIVITHVDDCCSVSRIRDVVVTADGEAVGSCQ